MSMADGRGCGAYNRSMKLTASYCLRRRFERFETAIQNIDFFGALTLDRTQRLATSSGPPLGPCALATVTATARHACVCPRDADWSEPPT